ncbi:hypothetical protein C8R47DRAFT_1209586 [Mycena vitilis]|nr:hypothetical protein C8R47DRAFT_1209586 [Mycena vitilis]
MPISRSPSVSSSGSGSVPVDGLRTHTEYLRKKRESAARAQHRREEHESHQARRNALENKRNQWKAASARYYENHPEVRARKKLKMTEQRAAKKLARRRWDPPTKVQVKAREAQLEIDREAASSLLSLQQRSTNPFPPDLPGSDEILTSADEDELSG